MWKTAMEIAFGPNKICTIFRRFLRLYLPYKTSVDISTLVCRNEWEKPFLFLDFEKAFDRVDRDFMWSSMKKMNFGPNFISYCQTLYAGSCSRVVINGHQTNNVQTETGVRQGCPIAALLYLLACEPMASLFRKDPNFQGMSIPAVDGFPPGRLCISQYCDDTLIYCRNLSDVSRAETNLQLYEIALVKKLTTQNHPPSLLSSLLPTVVYLQRSRMTTRNASSASTSE